MVSQRSLQDTPVAVKGTHQCNFMNSCGTSGSQQQGGRIGTGRPRCTLRHVKPRAKAKPRQDEAAFGARDNAGGGCKKHKSGGVRRAGGTAEFLIAADAFAHTPTHVILAWRSSRTSLQAQRPRKSLSMPMPGSKLFKCRAG